MCRFSGDPAGIRTPDPLLKRQLLCRLSYRIRVKHLLPINHWPRGRIHGQWQGRLDSNQRMRESKSLALPLGYAPKWKKEGTGDTPAPSCLGWVMGLEPTTPGTTIQCSANCTTPTTYKNRSSRRRPESWYARRDSNPRPTA